MWSDVTLANESATIDSNSSVLCSNHTIEKCDPASPLANSRVLALIACVREMDPSANSLCPRLLTATGTITTATVSTTEAAAPSPTTFLSSPAPAMESTENEVTSGASSSRIPQSTTDLATTPSTVASTVAAAPPQSSTSFTTNASRSPRTDTATPAGQTAVGTRTSTTTTLAATGPPPQGTSSPSFRLTAAQEKQAVIAYAIQGSSAMVSGLGAPADAQLAARLFSAMRMLRCGGDDAVAQLLQEARPATNASLPDANTAAPMTFPRSLLPMLTVNGSQWLGAIVANTAAVTLAALSCIIASFFALSQRGDRPIAQSRWASVRFPSLPAAIELATVDGTTFAAVSALLAMLDDSAVMDGAVAAAGLLSGVVAFGYCVGVVVRSPLAWMADCEQVAASNVVVQYLLMRRGAWFARPSGCRRFSAEVDADGNGGGGGLSSDGNAPGAAAGDDREEEASAYVAMHRVVVAASRGGPGALAACARYSSAVEMTFTVATALLEALGTSRCERQRSAAIGSLVVSCVAFGFALVVAAHPAPVKAALHAVSAAFCSLVSLFVVFALHEEEVKAAEWTHRAQSTMLVASGVGVASTAVSVATWWLRRRLPAPPGAAFRSPLLSTAEEMTSAPLLRSPSGGDVGKHRANPLLQKHGSP